VKYHSSATAAQPKKTQIVTARRSWMIQMQPAIDSSGVTG
jgi:hypothetical protein